MTRTPPFTPGRALLGRFDRMVVLPASMTAVVFAVQWIGGVAPPVRDALSGAGLVLAPLGAAVAGWLASRSLTGSGAAAWGLFAAAGLLAGVAQFVLATAGPEGAGSAAHALQLIAMALLAFAVAWTLHLHDRDRSRELGLDAWLIMVALAVVVMRWTPALAGDGPGGAPDSVWMTAFGSTMFAVCAVLLSLVLMSAWRGSPSGATGLALACGTIAIGAGTLPAAWAQRVCCDEAGFGAAFFVVGWLALAYAGVHVHRQGATAFGLGERGRGALRLRQMVAPTVVFVMAATIVDAALRPPLPHYVAIAISLLAVLLAVRVNQLLSETRRLSEERRELAHRRALVEVSQSLAAGGGELGHTLELVTRWAAGMLHGRAAMIELLDGTGRALEIRCVHGIDAAHVGSSHPVEGSFTGAVLRAGQPRTALSGAVAYGPAMREALRALEPLALTSVALRYEERTLGVLTWVGSEPLDALDVEVLGALADQAAIAIENARLFEQVHAMSMTDPLTGLANRRQLEHDLSREFAAAVRGRRLVAVMFDVNGFKEYNDTHGHLAGDAALRVFGEVLRRETRIMNFAARYGGDEFIALLADSDLQGARVFVQRVRQRFMQELQMLGEHGLSVSAGIATYSPDMRSAEQLVAAADAALYEAKRAIR